MQTPPCRLTICIPTLKPSPPLPRGRTTQKLKLLCLDKRGWEDIFPDEGEGKERKKKEEGWVGVGIHMGPKWDPRK